MKYIVVFISVATMLLFNGCATYKKQTYTTPLSIETSNKNTIDYAFYLIGDAGKNFLNKTNPVLTALKAELDKDENSSVLFLGDNIYPNGMPPKHSKKQSNANEILDAQLAAVKDYSGKVIFISGNHDWYNGLSGLKQEADYIEKALNNKEVFFPSKGCPIDEIKINNRISIIAIDSQWYLEDWNKQPTINDNCNIKTREDFFLEIESLLRKNEEKTTIIALHHPMFSNGPHGGQFSFNQQLKPFPIIGSLESLIRKTGGVSPQDLQNKRYLELRKRVVTLSQAHEKVILVSGHEHNLQYLVKNNIPQIISGAGSKISPIRQKEGAFGFAGAGFAKLVVYNDGSSDVFFYDIQNNAAHLVYHSPVLKADKKPIVKPYNSFSNEWASTSIYTTAQTSVSGFHTKLWGKRYRDYYSKTINVKPVDLDTLFGGLTPLRKGGGHQSRSLRLVNKNGQEYVMRALKKSATQYLQAVAFKDQYIEGKFDDTAIESLLSDIFTGSHPYAPLVVGTLADGANVYHSNPKLFYIAKQKALKDFNDEFGDELYIIEERISSGHGDVNSFGNADKIISTNDLFKNLRKNSNYSIDEPAYIRARLFDMLIGDWDRHEDQWRWAEFEANNGHKIYKPIPRDRDQAFSIMSDGAFLSASSSLIPSLRFLKSYDAQLKKPKWFNLEPFPLDKALITMSDKSVWDTQVKYIQTHLTDAIIEKAFNNMPPEMMDQTITNIKLKLKGRLQNLQEISDVYQKLLNNYVIIKGTDNADKFDIERLSNGKTDVKIFQIKNDKLFYDRTFTINETKEIWIYGLDDNDIFNVYGDEKSPIKVRLIGGQNKDNYNIDNGKKLMIYDYKSKNNTFKTNKGNINLTDDYDTNIYNFKKPLYNVFQMLPNIGTNKDDGLKIGVSNTYTLNKFERNPFTQQHILNANYYLATSGYELNYSSEFANLLLKNWNFKISAQYTSPNYSINFFGFGNNSKNLDDIFDEDFNRVKIKTFEVSPALVWHGPLGAQFSLIASYESKVVEKTLNRFINSTTDVSQNVFNTQHFIGAGFEYHFENYDNKSFPTLGLKSNLQAGFKTNTNTDKNFSYLIPSLAIDYKLDEAGTLVLATKVKAHIIFGEGFEFYQASTIGANEGLRGYRNQRFTGKNSFYQSTDLRLKLNKSHSSFIPLQMGLFGGFDYGRVWFKNDAVNVWHTSYGGGFWFNAAGLISSRIALFNSADGALLSFGLGFEF